MSVVVDRSVRRVLIFRLGSLGDTIVALPAFHLIARAFPDAERIVLTDEPRNAQESDPDGVLGVPESGAAGELFAEGERWEAESTFLPRRRHQLGHADPDDSSWRDLRFTEAERFLAIAPGAKPGIRFSQGAGHRVVYHRFPSLGGGRETCARFAEGCITSITVDEIAAACEDMLTPTARTDQLTRAS
jgi:hypothetical protein